MMYSSFSIFYERSILTISSVSVLSFDTETDPRRPQHEACPWVKIRSRINVFKDSMSVMAVFSPGLVKKQGIRFPKFSLFFL